MKIQIRFDLANEDYEVYNEILENFEAELNQLRIYNLEIKEED